MDCVTEGCPREPDFWVEDTGLDHNEVDESPAYLCKECFSYWLDHELLDIPAEDRSRFTFGFTKRE